MKDELVEKLRGINRNYDLARGVHIDIAAAADRIKSLEAKLEKAREGLEGARDFLIDEVGFADSDPPLEQVQAALKELSQ